MFSCKPMFKFFLFIFIVLITSLYAQYGQIVEQYDILTTIAGKGDEDDKGFNGWKAEYEGGLAIDAELSRPHFVMADGAGVVYIADKDAHAIRKIMNDRIYTAAGTNTPGFNGDGMATEHQLHSPNGLWVQEDGAFFVLDLGNSRIRKVTSDGNMVTILDDPNGISIGRGLWVSDDEKTIYYSSGSQVKKWSKSGGLIVYASGFSQLGNLIVDSQGHLVVTDRGANLVYRVFDDGSKSVIAGNGASSGGGHGYLATETGLNGVRGIWYMQDMSYFLATHEGSQIWYVDASGVMHLFLDGKEGDEYHSGDGKHFQSPGYKISEARSLSIDLEGNMLIAENDRGFIRKIQKKADTFVVRKASSASDLKISAYPNPFNSSIGIEYNLEQQSHISVTIYDILGNHIKTLMCGIQPAGILHLRWDATNQNNQFVNSGVYLFSIKSNHQIKTGKIVYTQ